MAQRRMFSKDIVESGAFMEMPLSTQALYLHLGMNADDDGFISNGKIIMRMCGAAEDDMRLLLAKRFLLAFDNGLLVVKHWKINNYIRPDRYHATVHQEEFKTLYIKQNQAYSDHQPEGIYPPKTKELPHGIPDGNQVVDTRYTQYSLGEDSLVKDNRNNSSEPKNGSEPTVAWLPLNTGKEYPIYQSAFEEWERLYPAVDVKQELNKMRGWCISNPTKRKTVRGINKFVNGWLSREQDRGGTRKVNAEATQPPVNSRYNKKYKTIVDEDGYFVDVEVTDEDGGEE